MVFIGCVGKDKYAENLKEAASRVGLRTEYRYDEEKPTGRCGVIITGHHRSMCTDLAAANCYKLEHLKSPEIWKLVEQAKVFFVGGYHLTVCPPAIMALAEEAAEKNKVNVCSPSSYSKISLVIEIRFSSSLSPLHLSPNSSRNRWIKPRHIGTTW